MQTFKTRKEALQSIEEGIREALVTTDSTYKELAEIFDVSISHISRVAGKHGIKREGRRPPLESHG